MHPTLEDSKLLGDFAEDVVCKYFEASGFSMTRFGVEHIFPKWLNEIQEASDALLNQRQSRIAHEQQQEFVRFLRGFPDFVAIRKEPDEQGSREIFPVEVKFRTERKFDGYGGLMTAIRLSQESVKRYKDYWPSTLLVVVCYHDRTMIATRASKPRERPDGRVPIRDSGWRQSWFYNVKESGFLPIWTLKQGYFDAEQGHAAVAEIIGWADLVKNRENLIVE
jgi:hypothetical protein